MDSSTTSSPVKARRPIVLYLIAGGMALVIGMLASVMIGTADTGLRTVWQAYVSFDESKEQLIIRTLRMPRAVLTILVGASLAVAGALMQAITRNHLASPQVFGVNAGASLVVVSAVVFFPAWSSGALVYGAFLGAALGGLIVYSMASGGGMSPVKLALAGMAVHLFLSSLTEGLIMFHEHTTESILYWLVGAVDGKDWDDVWTVLPWSVGGIVAALLMSPSITILGLGEEVAQGLGQRTGAVRLAASLLVIVLAGASVAVAGPIGFVGLIIPHIVRRLVGEDYRLVLPFSALFGALLLLYADILSRFIAYPFESPVGIVTAMIGAPFFLYLARKGRASMDG